MGVCVLKGCYWCTCGQAFSFNVTDIYSEWLVRCGHLSCLTGLTVYVNSWNVVNAMFFFPAALISLLHQHIAIACLAQHPSIRIESYLAE